MIKIPQALKKETQLEKHGDLRIDNYYWLNERENPEVQAYLEEENVYYQEIMQPHKEFEEKLYQEIKGKIKEDDSSVPYLHNGYYYITRFEQEKDYPIYSRKKESLEASEEILFDCNELSKSHTYFKLGGIEVSPDNKMAVFAVDTVGRRMYTLRFKNLETGEILSDQIENTTGDSAWANDNQTLFYSTQDSQTLRSDKIYKHQLGESFDKDQLVFFEKDDTFDVSVYKEKSGKYVVIGSTSTLTSEYQILDADFPKQKFRLFQKRKRGLDYSISHHKDVFYIICNGDGATNFKIMVTPENQTTSDYWKDFVPHRDAVLIEDLDVFNDYLVVSERENGLSQLHIVPFEGDSYYIKFDNETYVVYTTTNVDLDTTILRYGYQSLTTPPSIIDFDMKTQKQKVQKQQDILDPTFDKNNYESQRIWATSHDGVKIPMSVVYKRGMQLNGSNPVLQYGYGSYGHTIDPTFSIARLSLLDRGFIFAIAHVRGSEYLGREWYEDGKLLKKKNTFYDFIACSKYLIEAQYTSPKHLYIQGGSAGGLLIGAVINMAPELYHAAIADVPFVDVVTTMLDDSIPLTTGEYDEWGDPNKKKYYQYMKSYSPYDNVREFVYPHLLVTTGLHDSQVQYWEPAKWVALLREKKQGDSYLFLDTNMETGHSGASGRMEALKEIAKEFSFIFKWEGVCL